MPFDSFRTAAIRPENYRSMLMNVFLFLPFGLTLSQSFRTDTKHRIGRSILAALALSVLIETMQYIFSIGVSEMDDVLCNTLGAFLGTCTIPLSSLLRRAQHNDDSLK